MCEAQTEYKWDEWYHLPKYTKSTGHFSLFLHKSIVFVPTLLNIDFEYIIQHIFLICASWFSLDSKTLFIIAKWSCPFDKNLLTSKANPANIGRFGHTI